MIEVLQSVVALIVTLSILVTFHEFGHYWVARMCNVHVLKFSVGFGRSIYTKRGKPPKEVPPPEGQKITTRSNELLEGTEFSIAAIPLGGYVKFLDERESYVPDDQLHLAFNRKSVLQRIAIVAAGPIANFILAIVAYWILFSVGVTGIVPMLGDLDPDSKAGRAGLKQGQEIVAIDGEPTRTWGDVNMQLFSRLGETGAINITVVEQNRVSADRSDAERSYQIAIENWMSGEENPYPTSNLGLQLNYPPIPAVISGIVEDGAADVAGLQVDDWVKAINDETIEDWPQFVKVIQAHPDQYITLSVLRENRLITLNARPEAVERDGKTVGFLGAQRAGVELPDDMRRIVGYPIYSAWIPALKKTWSITVFTLNSIKKMLMGAISPKNLSGPITIAQVASATAQSGLESFVGFIALLSISLGVLNLLPIPILDGGHLLYFLVELVTRRQVPERIQVWGLQVGMFLLVGVMMLAVYNDIMRL